MNMLNDELRGVFAEDPPNGSLKDLSCEPIIKAPPAEWELDTTWSEYVASLPDYYEEVRSPFFLYLSSRFLLLFLLLPLLLHSKNYITTIRVIKSL